MKTNIKTLDINFKSWFDKKNGNTYNAGYLIINYGMTDAQTVAFPYAYGYGDFYKQRVAEHLIQNAASYNLLIYNASNILRTLQDTGKIIRTSIIPSLKRDLKAIK
jgi:hypothetical protein